MNNISKKIIFIQLRNNHFHKFIWNKYFKNLLIIKILYSKISIIINNLLSILYKIVSHIVLVN